MPKTKQRCPRIWSSRDSLENLQVPARAGATTRRDRARQSPLYVIYFASFGSFFSCLSTVGMRKCVRKPPAVEGAGVTAPATTQDHTKQTTRSDGVLFDVVASRQSVLAYRNSTLTHFRAHSVVGVGTVGSSQASFWMGWHPLPRESFSRCERWRALSLMRMAN